MPRHLALVALGGNLASAAGAPADTLQAAFSYLRQYFGDIVTSALFRNPAFPAGSGPDYVNAAARLDVAREVTPRQLLDSLHQIETSLGRTRLSRWSGRTLDLDLLAFDDLVLPDPATQDHWRTLPPERQRVDIPDQLILPHPRLQDRAFVLVPLSQVAAGWRHPVLGLTVDEMLATVPESEKSGVIAL